MYLLDFGLSKQWFELILKQTKETSGFRHIGGVSTWSPESLKNPENISAKHDIWSLGILFYQLLTGDMAFESANFGEYYEWVINMNQEKEFQMMRKVESSILMHIIERCFERNYENRICLRDFMSMIEHYSKGLIDILRKRKDDIYNLYLDNDGDLWGCPNCNSIMKPNGAMCTRCGCRDEFYDLETSIKIGL